MSSDRSIPSLAVGIVLILILALSLNSLFKPQPPILEIQDFSLEPKSIKAGQTAALTFSIKSNDKDASHFLRVEFESHTLVVFLLGNDLLPDDNGKWFFTKTFNPGEISTQPITVKAALESGYAEAKYGITVNFFVDGNQFESKKEELTVTWP
jgi:hypothetical protein